ncbi:protein-L-isoaspartate(D-aspartate) O-methyltransferase [Actinomadura sp. KC06]|uniref:protein-L-isoaspartate O-methyltransferase family protein n=1 Tax=Actinomadura sp. KC06 TaxID=2530369 RepID=UPI0010451E11|nr:rRNA adenine N-6-methyltransferase family protein [Actinomadura sp. KC06]TDD34672.1 protein-L-isoaspartate(D-aspartate) O-methyltransferase [Actinomadura sp. KC06]
MGTGDTTAWRGAMVDELKASGAVRSQSVEEAMRQVPRERFLPTDLPPEDAYADRAVTLTQDGHGFPASTASQPTIVARMLEQLDARPGHRVLEIGTAGGYNAALLAHLADRVVSLEIDPALAERAARRLGPAVDVRAVDGADGAPDAAPFDRIQATVGVWGLPAAWFEQLTPGGRLVVPLWLRPGLEVSVAFERHGDVLRGLSCEPCAFLRLRGAHAGPDGYRPLGDGHFVTADFLDPSGTARLGRLLNEKPTVEEAVPGLARGWFPSLALADERALQIFSLHTGQASSGLYDQRAGALALIRDDRLFGYGDAALSAELRTRAQAAEPLDPADLQITARLADTSPRGSARWSLSRPPFQYDLQVREAAQ